MKVLIIASRFFMGGFSKSLINFLLCADKYPELDITVMTVQKNVIDDYKEIPSRFNYIALDSLEYREPASKGLNKDYIFSIQRIRNIEYVLIDKFCKILRKPIPYKVIVKFMSFSEANRAKRVITDFTFCNEFDVAISWEEIFCNYLLAEKIPVKCKIGYIHPNYNEVGFSKAADKPYLKKLDRIVTISESCYETLKIVYPEFKNKIICLPNRMNLNRINKLADEYVPKLSKETFNIVTVCRISDHDKAVFRIVDLAKSLKQNGYVFKWYLIGDGPDLNELKERIATEKLEEYIICLGQKDNPYPYIKKADLYVQQSYVEGKPVSVDESLILNTPVIITDYSSAREQVEDGVTGFICKNNTNDILEKLSLVLGNPKTLKRIKQHLISMDKSDYENCNEIIDALNEVCAKNN